MCAARRHRCTLRGWQTLSSRSRWLSVASRISLEYLSHPSLLTSPIAAKTIESAFPLHELVARNLMPALVTAARSGSTSAQLKLGVWRLLTKRESDAVSWFKLAAKSGNDCACTALRALETHPAKTTASLLRIFHGEPGIDPHQSVVQVLNISLGTTDSEHVAHMLECALIGPSMERSPDLADAVCAALWKLQHDEWPPPSLDTEKVEMCLEDCIRRGNAKAALLLGRALSGIESSTIRASQLATGHNMRRGAALLLRAADSGIHEAWAHLYRIHADSRASVSNPQMARFFLEKAAAAGDACAQRMLGALILRSATRLHESEQGIHWLHQAAQRNDQHAAQLLSSLVLPVAGIETQATSAIDAVCSVDPWLACRLRTARDFGLTKLEALNIDIVTGQRPWGLVVGHNPSIAQAKLAEPRAVPALTPLVLENLRRTVAFFEQSRRDGGPTESDRRRRSRKLRYCLQHAGIEESLFFAEARSTVLCALRQGPKWAFHARPLLQMALSEI